MQLLLFWLLLAVAAASDSGYCRMYGNCGKKSVFGGEIPCFNHTKAVVPTQQTRQLLQQVCGPEFDTETVCCSEEQVLNLQTNLKKAEPLISSCPACSKNFHDFFCKFTCSPDQAAFLDVLKTQKSIDKKKEIVSEIDISVSNDTAAGFYDSCKNIKFSATNGYAMDLIGGGARNFAEFLKFLGDEKPLLGGLPFQINFRYDSRENQLETPMKGCNDEKYKCACLDCPLSCPELPYFHADRCRVGKLPCFSVLVAVFWIALIAGLGVYHIQLARRKRNQFRRINELIEDEHQRDEVPLITTHCSGPKSDKSGVLADFQQKTVATISDGFGKLGLFFATHPISTILSSLVVLLVCFLGLSQLQWETNPVNLWVSPNEPVLHEAQYFEDTFGEWFRIEQIFVASKEKPVLDWENVQWWFAKEQELAELGNQSLSDFCFKPLGESCAIELFAQYFNGDIRYLNKDNWASLLVSCTNLPVQCLPSFQQPLRKNLLFSSKNVLNSEAFVVTLLLNKKLQDQQYTQNVVEYEHALQKWVKDLQKERPDLEISFSTETSLEEELNQSTNTDVKIVVILYLVMFLYASVALGGRIPARFSVALFVKTRFLLGMSGILIILFSVAAAGGILGFLGVRLTLIIAEVIPFLVLAIGVDNIFLVVHELRAQSEITPDRAISERISAALARVGPLCLASASIQVSMFLLAATVQMPAVRNFALYSAGAVFVNFLLQMLAFISVLALDQKRIEQGRMDVFPWIRATILDEEKHLTFLLARFFREKYAVWLLRPKNKRKILAAFVLWFGILLSLFPAVELGLDQKIALPQDSYLVNYFSAVAKYLNVGPPTFFVLRDLDVTKREDQQAVCGKFSTCDEFSVANVLEQEYKRGNQLTIAEPASNWLDDFFNWLNPQLDQCCRFRKGSSEFCSPFAPLRQCQPCYEDRNPPYNISMEGLPEGSEFMKFFRQWISEPSDPCPLGGKAPYLAAVNYSSENIRASYLRTSHTPLRTQADFISAFANGQRIASEISKYGNTDVYAYLPFYVFFVQYATIVKTTFKTLALALAVVFAVSAVLLGLAKTALVLCAVLAAVLVNIGGAMAISGVSLNAVSLVNLVICLGLAVEFSVHIAKGFLDADDSDLLFQSFMDESTDFLKEQKTMSAYKSLSHVGASVLEGITLTKLIGVSVLFFTRSKIFEVYYFRMWLSLVVIASVHALALLPILQTF